MDAAADHGKADTRGLDGEHDAGVRHLQREHPDWSEFACGAAQCAEHPGDSAQHCLHGGDVGKRASAGGVPAIADSEAGAPGCDGGGVHELLRNRRLPVPDRNRCGIGHHGPRIVHPYFLQWKRGFGMYGYRQAGACLQHPEDPGGASLHGAKDHPLHREHGNSGFQGQRRRAGKEERGIPCNPVRKAVHRAGDWAGEPEQGKAPVENPKDGRRMGRMGASSGGGFCITILL